MNEFLSSLNAAAANRLVAATLLLKTDVRMDDCSPARTWPLEKSQNNPANRESDSKIARIIESQIAAPERRLLIYPGSGIFPLGGGVEVIPLVAASEALLALH